MTGFLFHLMASGACTGILTEEIGQFLIFQAETNFTFVTFIDKVFCRFSSGKLHNIAPVFATVFFSMHVVTPICPFSFPGPLLHLYQ